jgi:hypothetical protein
MDQPEGRRGGCGETFGYLWTSSSLSLSHSLSLFSPSSKHSLFPFRLHAGRRRQHLSVCLPDPPQSHARAYTSKGNTLKTCPSAESPPIPNPKAKNPHNGGKSLPPSLSLSHLLAHLPLDACNHLLGFTLLHRPRVASHDLHHSLANLLLRAL